MPAGASYNFLFFSKAFEASSSNAATPKPMSGESSNDSPILTACPQSTPLVPVFAAISWLAIPTPMTEPIRVCELDAGSPKYQVPRFQIMAAINSANTMANPALLPTCRISSTGSSETMAKATNPLEVSTPKKFQNPDHTTAMCGSREWV